jgi:hypothetical protein
MQIIITEVEIAIAITNYIKEQIKEREGTQIDVNLFATRGDTGFTATINIITANSKAEAFKLTAQPTSNAGVVANAVEPKEEKKTEPAALPEISTSSASEVQTPKLFSHLQNKPTAPTVDAEEPKQKEAEAEKPQTAPPRSLFASLKKPVNTQEALM